jgi:cAMP phosphodiesterase
MSNLYFDQLLTQLTKNNQQQQEQQLNKTIDCVRKHNEENLLIPTITKSTSCIVDPINV